MSSQKDRMAAECFRKGNDAVNKGDWDMAEAMFSTCVKLKPGLLNYRQLLRNSTKKKYKDNGKGKGTFGAMTIRGIRSKMSKAKTSSTAPCCLTIPCGWTR